ncbi:hypothetical protein [Ferruginibacter sp.]|nr:hypothetical protein [Ferruginibacter sp.]
MNTPINANKPDNAIDKSLTAAQLRSFPGCDHYSDTEAAEIIQSLEKLSAICYEQLGKLKIHSIDNQYVVSLNSHQHTKTKAA